MGAHTVAALVLLIVSAILSVELGPLPVIITICALLYAFEYIEDVGTDFINRNRKKKKDRDK